MPERISFHFRHFPFINLLDHQLWVSFCISSTSYLPLLLCVRVCVRGLTIDLRIADFAMAVKFDDLNRRKCFWCCEGFRHSKQQISLCSTWLLLLHIWKVEKALLRIAFDTAGEKCSHSNSHDIDDTCQRGLFHYCTPPINLFIISTNYKRIYATIKTRITQFHTEPNGCSCALRLYSLKSL